LEQKKCGSGCVEWKGFKDDIVDCQVYAEIPRIWTGCVGHLGLGISCVGGESKKGNSVDVNVITRKRNRR